MTDYLNNGNAADAINGVKEMRAPKHFISEMISLIVLQSLDRSDEDKERASELIGILRQEGVATSDNFMQVYCLIPSALEGFTPPHGPLAIFILFFSIWQCATSIEICMVIQRCT